MIIAAVAAATALILAGLLLATRKLLSSAPADSESASEVRQEALTQSEMQAAVIQTEEVLMEDGL